MADAMGSTMMNRMGMQDPGAPAMAGGAGGMMGAMNCSGSRTGYAGGRRRHSDGAEPGCCCCGAGMDLFLRHCKPGEILYQLRTAKALPAGWTCSCGTVNQGKFCMNCVQRGRKALRFLSVTNAAGSRRIRRIPLNFARNAAISLTTATSVDVKLM